MTITTQAPYDLAPPAPQSGEYAKSPRERVAEEIQELLDLHNRTVDTWDSDNKMPAGRYSEAISKDPVQKEAYLKVYNERAKELMDFINGSRKVIRVKPDVTEVHLPTEKLSTVESNSKDAVDAVQGAPYLEDIVDQNGNHVQRVINSVITIDELKRRALAIDDVAIDRVKELMNPSRTKNEVVRQALASTIEHSSYR